MNSISSSVEVVASNNVANDGGGIEFNGGESILSDSTISHNTSVFAGGILSQLFGTLDISRTEVSYNVANGNGGGILNFRNSLSVTESNIVGNEARGLIAADGNSGGIENVGFGAQAVISNSLVSQNSAAAAGGGIGNYDATLDVVNTNVSDNHANLYGGGIRSFGGIALATITDSVCGGDGGTGGNGGPGGNPKLQAIPAHCPLGDKDCTSGSLGGSGTDGCDSSRTGRGGDGGGEKARAPRHLQPLDLDGKWGLTSLIPALELP